MLDREIAEFGRRMNMDGLQLDENGLVVLDIDNIGRLYLEKGANHSLFMYLCLPYPSYDENMARKILEICAYQHGHPLSIRGGLYGGWALLLTEFDENTVDAARLETGVRILSSTLEQVFG